ncbi:peptidoglycan-associated lipoprotein Pal [Sphingopyxis sp. BSNA05]|uniref:peptidoglycan-associated lipoprotein Pal n=1 Tax=Sphingopyxis sp. BSNA05 TaxID=1236614 RepID=UPI00156730D3|nr:peptidoglycan-associated lipoprotein Pal [Sphingopyxis sp. BSNA05]NRD89380.1 peptidoglycan-associated lipoprotein Pal [Sphingopyxis sp. BSNA05]
MSHSRVSVKLISMPLLVAALALSGCSKKAPEGLPPAPGDNMDYNSAPGGPIKGSQEDFLANVASDRIFFETDRSDVDSEDQQILRSQATWLIANPSVRIRVEGHCDERGTREYNLALGERRANAAKNYLSTLGVALSRISVVSYGKERPDALGSDETAWQKNRRAVTVTVR